MTATTSDARPFFTIVIPAYEAERHLGAAIQSVLDQSLAPELTEVVVVNDGSTDGTQVVCDVYATLHPERVRVFSKENGGVSSALNLGVREARGEVIGFLGSDDLLTGDTLESVYEFFLEHGEEVDLAAIALHMFGARKGPHWNNRSRFDTTRVIDVREEWNLTQVHGGGSFIRASVFDSLSFEEDLFITEDATLNTEVILRSMKYGVVANARYLNRRYPVGGSLVSGSQFRPEFYTEIPRLAYQRMLDAGRQLHGEVPRYAQAMVAYDLSWRVRGDISMMDPSLEEPYRETLRDLLKQLDVEVIMAQKAPIEVRLAMLNLREGGRLNEGLEFEKGLFSLDSYPIYSLKAKPAARHRPIYCDIEFFEPQGDEVILEGHFRAVEIGNWDYSVEVGKRRYPVEILADNTQRRHNLAGDLVTSRPFRVRIRLASGETLRPILQIGDATYPLSVRMNRFTRFSGSPNFPYYRRDGQDVYRLVGPFGIQRRTLSGLGVVKAELGFLKRGVQGKAAKADLRERLATFARRRFQRREIWLMGDHKSEAGDNGEAMFRYLCEHPIPGVEPRFVLLKTAKEYKELSRLGKVVEPNSLDHIRSYLDAAVVMNSAGDEYMLNPLGSRRTLLNDLAKGRSVFLQHGVTKDDQSGWLNHWAKGFDLFVTSAAREHESIVDGPYDYRAEQIALTGMPRFDRLVSEPDKLIVFAPTWRRGLSGSLDKRTGRVRSSSAFADSDYFRFWQEVISDPRLNEVMRARGYRGIFALHPSHAAEAGRFTASDQIAVGRYPHNYRDFFTRGEVLVTDYSSVAFDFAYLRKPVVYVQGDREEFFSGHLYTPGYYSYDEDGFGPVVDTVSELVDQLLALILADCEMDETYRSRVDSFFAFEGGGNSERLRIAIESSLGR